MNRYFILFACAWLCLSISLAVAEDKPEDTESSKMPTESVEKIAEKAGESVALITVEGRDGKRYGLGTGFIIDSSGLIATNLHVIGEARPMTVQLASGKKYEVTSVHASDRALDLAVVRIDAKDLPALPLGDSDKIVKGQPTVVLGNPHGLKDSVVSGVISGRREIEDRKMIQLAIPIEPGNSGGPVLDSEGRVVGIVTMKSAVTDNLGFAMPINSLRSLLEKPNPIPVSRWLTIGAIDPKEWTTLFGARWQQRSGRIIAKQAGKGFGGRSLCLSTTDQPELPYEVAVKVRLNDEAGAAGLVFHSDGNHKHYGFYPSAGKLRLTRFEGSSVYTWTVLHNEPSQDYLPGQWNHLKVRLEKDKILCYVNDQLVLTSKDHKLTSGKVGLAKFRQTEAEFKSFQIAKSIPSGKLAPEVVQKLNEQVDKLPDFKNLLPEQIEPLTKSASSSAAVLRERAKKLEARAEQLRRLASDVHVHATAKLLAAELSKQEDQIDLSRAALLVARLDDDEVDVQGYVKEVDRMATDIQSTLPEKADTKTRLEALRKYMFTENGFHGSRTDYYHRANSHLNRVIDDREGLPITLSVLYIELGRRIGLNIVGVGLPGHFVVRHEPKEGKAQLIDVFDNGKALSKQDAVVLVTALSGTPFKEDYLKAVSKKDIVQRMLGNLLGIARRADKPEEMLRYLEAIVAVSPEDHANRGMRALVRFKTGRRDAAIADIDWFLENKPEDLDLEKIREMRDYFLHGQP